MKGKISTQGYKNNSPDKNNEYNIIPSNRITMKNVPHPVWGIDEYGNTKLMMPGEEHMFKGNTVLEIPVKNSTNMNYKKQAGGEMGLSPRKAKAILKDGTVYGHPISESQRNYFANIAGTDLYGEDLDSEDNDSENDNQNDYSEADIAEMKKGGNWIPKNLKKGRCTPAPNADCPVGSPQYNLAMTFKKHHGFHKKQVGGPFTPPTNAEKVNQAPSDFNLLGTQGGKTFYDKAAAKATSSSGSTPSPGWEEGIKKMLQSGTSPESLVKAGHIDKSQMEKFRPFYKAVYTEQPQTNTPAKKPIPLDVSGTIDRKEITLPGTQKYKTYQYPDPNAGYGNPSLLTTKHFDPATDQEIDPLKSFDASGNYKPSFLNTGPKSTGTLKQPMDANGNVIQTKNPLTAALSTGFKMGGPYIKQAGGSNIEQNEGGTGSNAWMMVNEFSKFMKNYMKKGGSSSPQGDTMNDYLAKNKNKFVDYLHVNMMRHIGDEMSNEFMNFGGTPFYQVGGANMEMNEYNYQAGGSNFQTNEYNYQNGGPYGPEMSTPQTNLTQFDNPLPDTGAFATNWSPSWQPSPNSMSPSYVNQGNAGANLDANTGDQSWLQKNKPNAADAAIGGADFIASMLENKNRLDQKKKMMYKTNADSLFSVNTQMNRGDYETNSGAFRPNKMTPTQYRKGGTFIMSEDEINRFLQMGGELEFVD